MKKLIMFIPLLLLSLVVFAQKENPVVDPPLASTVVYISVFAGMMMNFIMEYWAKKKADTSFSAGFWIKDNWLNFVIIAVCLTAYFFINEDLPSTKMAAFLIGFGGNKIVDYFQDFMSKNKS